MFLCSKTAFYVHNLQFVCSGNFVLNPPNKNLYVPHKNFTDPPHFNIYVKKEPADVDGVMKLLALQQGKGALISSPGFTH